MKLRIFWILIYAIAILLSFLSLNVRAGVIVVPVAAVALLCLALSFRRKLHFLRIVGHLAATSIIGLLVFLPVMDSVIAPLHARRKAKQVLSQAQDEAGRQAAVGSLGLVLSYTNGQWIAIRYRDSHAWPGWSMAVALDSDGMFYQSRRHFCGLLSSYAYETNRRKEYAAESAALGETNTVDFIPRAFKEIDALATANGLQNAKAHLQRMGFEPLAD